MTWFKVDDNLTDHPKVLALGKDRLPAIGLWTLVGAWAGRYDTGGAVPEEIVRRHDPRLRLAGRLVAAGLWERVVLAGNHAFKFHDWEDMQPSPEELERKKAKNRERQRRFRQRRHGIDPTDPGPGDTPDVDAVEGPADDLIEEPDSPPSNGACNALRDALVTVPRPDPTRPVSTSSGDLGGGASSTERTRAAQRPPTDDPQQQLNLLGSVPAGLPSEAPRCSRHARLPADVDVPPCRPCQRRRESWEADIVEHVETQAQREREVAGARQRAAEQCDQCDGRWVSEYPGGPPVEPATKCDHGIRVVAVAG